jgi:photosystem II stability/assembly factor-like uncharacterized protein
MRELTDSLRDMVEASAVAVTLDEVVARADRSAFAPSPSRSRRPILVALVTVVTAALAVGLVVHSTTPTGTHHTPTVGTSAPLIPRVEPGFSTQAVSAPNPNDIWTVGGASDGTPRVYLSTDGGLHWIDVTPPNLANLEGFTGLFALDGTRAWLSILTGSEAQSHSFILRTVDSGRTWTSTPSPGGEALYYSFIDSTHGWVESSLGAAAGAEGVDILRTVDGGGHWQLISRGATPDGHSGTPGSLDAGCDKSGITFVDAQTGFATEACNGGGPGFYVTHDAGRTWKPVSIRGSVPQGDGTEVHPPAFSGRDGAAFVNAGKAGLMLVSSDGGDTWAVKSLPPPVDRYPSDLVDATHWWFVAGSTIEYTADAGDHFVSFPAPARTIFNLWFASRDSGWASSDSGSLFATTDGARTWRLVDPSAKPGS